MKKVLKATTLFLVSQSKIKDWRQCRQLYYYKHVLKIERRKKARPLKFGTLMHKMKEAFAKGLNPFKTVLDKISPADLRLFAEEREAYGDIIADTRYLFAAYLEYYKATPLVFLKHGKTIAEHPFEVELPKEDILVKGTIDAATSHRKMTWLTEHKNHKVIPDADERWRNIQSVVYIRISDMLGWWDFEGTCWDYIRSKPPTRPQILKSGEISERALDSLPQIVVDTLKENKIKIGPREQAIFDTQRRNLPTWFQRVYTPVKTQVLDHVWKDFVATAREMRDANTSKPQVRTIGRHCSWCEMEPLCRAAMQGSDEEFIIEHEYQPSTYGEKDEKATEE